jgi:hypothetical protein
MVKEKRETQRLVSDRDIAGEVEVEGNRNAVV